MRLLSTASLISVALLAAPLAHGQERVELTSATQAGVALQGERAFAECPVEAINKAYRDAATREGTETFALLAIEQDTLRQCIERSQLIARLIEANNQIAQEIGIAAAESGALQPAPATPPQNCAPLRSEKTGTERAAPQTSNTENAADAVLDDAQPAEAPLVRPALSCARGFEVVYTAGTGRRLTALIQRRDEQWHVTKGFALPGGVTVKTIERGEVVISEYGEDHILPAAAAQSDADNGADE